MDAEDYLSLMDGTPSDELLGRLKGYYRANPEARIAARAWLMDRVARATDTGPIHVHVGNGDAEHIAASICESLRKYAAAKTPVQPPPTHAKPMPASALGLQGKCHHGRD